MHVESERVTFRTALWNFLIKEVLGVDNAKDIGDRYEITRVTSYPQDVTLGDRVRYLHNNQIVQSLSLNGTYGNTISILANIDGRELLDCGERRFQHCFDLIESVLDIEFVDRE